VLLQTIEVCTIMSLSVCYTIEGSMVGPVVFVAFYLSIVIILYWCMTYAIIILV
jgi:mannose/fructose/N-acetylgalactosamine-specific phosphotransferase system component IID